MERWQWQVVEAVYVAAQGEKAEAVARLHRMELLFRKTGHVAGEIIATGCRGLVQASIAMTNHDISAAHHDISAARQLLMRSVYLAQEQKHQAEEEVAATVADKCALQLSWVVVDMKYEEAVGWFRLQRAPEMAVYSFRLILVRNILLVRTHGRGTRLWWWRLIHEAHLQVREAAREVLMMSTSIMDDGNPWPVCEVLLGYESVAEAAVKRKQLSRALDMLREALALGSSSSSVGPFLSIGAYQGWHLWAWGREEAIRYRMGRLLVKLRPGDKINLAAALAMFAISLQCALRDYDTAADEECRLRRANAAWWARLTIQVLKGCPPPEFAEAATCSVMEELAGPGRLGWSPISRSQELMDCLVEVVEVLVFFPPWQALVLRHMEALRAHLDIMRGTRVESGEDDDWLLFRCTHTLATACRRAGDRRTAARHFMRCRDMGLKQLIAATALVDAGEVEAAERRVQQVLSLLTASPADESSPWPRDRPKLHAGLLAFAGNLLHLCGHRDAALDTLSQAWDVFTASGCSWDFITDNHAQQPRYILSEDETSSHGQQPRDSYRILIIRELEDEVLDIGIEMGLFFLHKECVRSGQEAAAADELHAAVNWYHKAADVARVFPSKQQVDMSHLSYRIGELQYKARAWMESLQMLSDCLRQLLLSPAPDTADISLWYLQLTTKSREVCDLIVNCQQYNFSLSTSPPKQPPSNWRKNIVIVHYPQVTEDGKFSTRPVDPPACRAESVVGHLLSPSLSGGSADKELDDTDLDESVDTERDVSALDAEPIDQPSLHQQLDSRGREVYPPGPASGRSTAWPAGPPASRLEKNFGQVQVAGRSNSGYPLSDVELFMLNEDSEFAQVPDMSSSERMIPTSISRCNSAVVVKKEVDSEVLLDTQQIRQNALFNEVKLRSDSARTSSANSLLVAPFEADLKTELEASLQKAHSGSGSRELGSGSREQVEESQSGKVMHQAFEIGTVCEGQERPGQIGIVCEEQDLERPGHEKTNKMRQDVCSFGFIDFTKPFERGQIMCLCQVKALEDDEVARIYFLHEEGMACVVGVGLTYSVVTLKAKSPNIYVTEIGKKDWEKMWTTSAQEDIIPTFPILFKKWVEPANFPSGVGIESRDVMDIEWKHPSISAGYEELEKEVNIEETWKDGEFNFETRLVGKSLLHGLMRSALLQGQQGQLLPILSPGDARQLGRTRAPAGDSTGNNARTDGLIGITNGSGSEFHRTQSLISKSESGMNEGNSGEAKSSITGIHTSGKIEGEHRFLRVKVRFSPHDTELNEVTKTGITPLVDSELPGEDNGVYPLRTDMVVEFFTNVKSNDESNLSGFREMEVTLSTVYGLDSTKLRREDFSNWYHKHLKSSFKCLDDSALERIASGTAEKTRLIDVHRNIAISKQETQGTDKGKAYTFGTTLGVDAGLQANIAFNTSNQVNQMASSTTGEQTSSSVTSEYVKDTMFSINDVSNGEAISFTASLSRHINMDQFQKEAIMIDAKWAGMLSNVEYAIWGRWKLTHFTNPQEYEVCVQRDLHSTTSRWMPLKKGEVVTKGWMTLKKGWMTLKKGKVVTKGKAVETFETRELLQHLTKRFLISHSFDQTYYRSEEWRWRMQNEPTCPIADVLRQA